MWRVALSFIVIILIVAFSFMTIEYLESSSNEILSVLDNISTLISEDNFEGAYIAMAEFYDMWERSVGFYKIIIGHNVIRQIDTSLAHATEYIILKDKSGSSSEISTLIYLIDDIYSSERLTIGNVF
jgi:hypothetical protein